MCENIIVEKPVVVVSFIPFDDKIIKASLWARAMSNRVEHEHDRKNHSL